MVFVVVLYEYAWFVYLRPGSPVRRSLPALLLEYFGSRLIVRTKAGHDV